MLIHNTIPVTPYNIFVTFRDTGKKLELKGDPLKMITIKNYRVNHANLWDKKLLFDFAREMFSDEKAPCNQLTRD